MQHGAGLSDAYGISIAKDLNHADARKTSASLTQHLHLSRLHPPNGEQDLAVVALHKERSRLPYDKEHFNTACNSTNSSANSVQQLSFHLCWSLQEVLICVRMRH